MAREDAVREFLIERGCPEHVVQAGLDGLMQQWEHVVDDVEEIYPLGLDDYLDDVDGRQLIAEALELAEERERKALLPRLKAADDKMKALVVPAGRCLWGSQLAEEHDWTPQKNWWYFTRPREPGPELAEDLENR